MPWRFRIPSVASFYACWNHRSRNITGDCRVPFDYGLRHLSGLPPGVCRTRFTDGTINPKVRVSMGIRDLGPFEPVLKSKVLGLVPDLVAKLRVTPLHEPKVELQLVAHHDGAFYKRHIDTKTASDRDRIRVLSAVYYFHAEPKAFAGGALRLYAIGGKPARTSSTSIPRTTACCFFHRGRRTKSRRRAAHRGALPIRANCWVHRKRP
jgi:SM-20-related protein